MKTWDNVKDIIAPGQSLVASFNYHPEFAKAAKSGKFEYLKKVNRWKLPVR